MSRQPLLGSVSFCFEVLRRFGRKFFVDHFPHAQAEIISVSFCRAPMALAATITLLSFTAKAINGSALLRGNGGKIIQSQQPQIGIGIGQLKTDQFW